MDIKLVEKIKTNENYKTLVETRSKFSLKLTAAVLIVYFTFILTIAFKPSVLGVPLSNDMVTTIGFPIGVFIIIFAFILTGVYTLRANNEFDDLINKIKKEVK